MLGGHNRQRTSYGAEKNFGNQRGETQAHSIKISRFTRG